MIQEAFEYSEKYGTPVFLRPTHVSVMATRLSW